MTLDAAQFADTLRLLLPGFVLTKTFYQFGLRTKRSDGQWVLWSILAAAPVAFTGALLVPLPNATALVIDIPVAIALGALLGVAWQLAAQRWPALRADGATRAWDELFQGESHWIEVTLKGDLGTYSGYALSVASSVDTDDLDLLIGQPVLVEGGSLVPIPGVESLLVRREDIGRIIVHERQPAHPAT